MTNSNTGHGHVFPRPDGAKARCGGPALCAVCAVDLVKQKAVSRSEGIAKPRIFRAIYRQSVGYEWVCRSLGATGIGSTPYEAYDRWKAVYWEPAEQFGRAIDTMRASLTGGTAR
ncbi:hypothetical protein KDX05_07080 [Burkholderia vietnamiensis]|uniref:hypothetical protein n=1 Tax=Burkholderia vietnamiensis TaxID=60552 RepID=UPI001B962E8B|nr:hypothetical protein [Burkholderia vietnamiensis]MBR8228074.1 hypothetical protein [Burkholderia vietnamiensis]